MHENKVALVTGANKGIGHAIASELAARGFTILVGARDASRGEAAARRIAGDARPITLDVTRAESIGAAAERIRCELGRLDVLVNNAGDIVDISSGEGSRDFWLEQNGCGSGTMSSFMGCQSYGGCPEESPVIWCTGNWNHTISSTAAGNIWSFFDGFK